MTTGGVVAVVPVRSFRNGKTRLAGAFSADARAGLARRMLARVVAAATSSGMVATTVVVSPDAAVLDAVADLGNAVGAAVVALAQEDAAAGLNAALDQGRGWAAGHGAAALLILFGDLPLLTAADVHALVRANAPLVLAPDRHGTGTNALRLSLDTPPGGGFRFQFGPDSYARHLTEARRLGLPTITLTAPGTALDLDTPEDVEVMGDGLWAMDDAALRAAARDVMLSRGASDR